MMKNTTHLKYYYNIKARYHQTPPRYSKYLLVCLQKIFRKLENKRLSYWCEGLFRGQNEKEVQKFKKASSFPHLDPSIFSLLDKTV